MNRVKAILAAGTLTGLVLVTILALSLGSDKTALASEPAAPVVVTQPVDANSVEALQAYNAQLEQALQTMQAREAQYQAQIEQANQTITQLQSQPQAAQSRVGFFGGEREGHERWEHDD